MVDIKELLAYKLQLHGGNELIKSLSANWAQHHTKSQFTEIIIEIEIDNFYIFPQSIPGQEEASQWFAKKMCHPSKLELRNLNLKTLVHGDLWHNNIYFNGDGQIRSNYKWSKKIRNFWEVPIGSLKMESIFNH